MQSKIINHFFFEFLILCLNCRIKQAINADLVLFKKKIIKKPVNNCKTYRKWYFHTYMLIMRRKLMLPENFTRYALVHAHPIDLRIPFGVKHGTGSNVRWL